MDKEALRLAASRIEQEPKLTDRYFYPHVPVKLLSGVVPKGKTAPVLAMDDAFDGNYCGYINDLHPGAGFPGYAYLSQLATRAEFRAMSNALSSEMTRCWIKFHSNDKNKSSAKKMADIEIEFKNLDVKGVIKRAIEQDCNFGRGQIFIDVGSKNKELPLVIDKRSIAKGALKRICNVEAIWTTPASYDAADPTLPNFYKPSKWFVLGKPVHSTRLLTLISNELPDILKPAFNFSGISLYQLAERYVDNWLRTQQAVSDTINNFSITGLATNMGQVMMGGDNGAALLDRARLFAAHRSNKGLMLTDKETEELYQQNTPLGGLHELQAQAQEHMCSVSRMPAIVLTGISPGGLNASSDSEIRVFYDWIFSQQEAYLRVIIENIMKIVMLSLFGEVDESIGFTFNPLFQLTNVEKADIRLKDSQSATAYVAAQVLAPEEIREKLASDEDSGFNGIDVDMVVENENDQTNTPE